MLLYRMCFGIAKKELAHYIVDCFTAGNSSMNFYLHDLTEALSAAETCNNLANALRRR